MVLSSSRIIGENQGMKTPPSKFASSKLKIFLI
jgi:hypothetical protein